MPQDPVRELADLTSVHAFYRSILENSLGYQIPAPGGMNQPGQGMERVEQVLHVMRKWLGLLDLAVSPRMMRNTVKDSSNVLTTEALLRYTVGKANRSPIDRDKTDLIATFLYRQRSISPANAARLAAMTSQFGPAAASSLQKDMEFERELSRVLGITEPPPLPEEHRQLAGQFNFIRQEVQELTDFDRLMESGLIARVREIKASFGPSFYHPRVLAALAEHNAMFGDKFAQLFRLATREIKEFAARIEQEGGSIMTRVDGDVIVKNLNEFEGSKLLQREYEAAKEDLRTLVKYKKAVERRGRSRAGEAAPAARVAPPRARVAPSNGSGLEAVAAVAGAASVLPCPVEPMHISPGGPSMAHSVEENKLRSIEDLIRNFICSAEVKPAYVVPLPKCKLPFSAAEVDCFRNEYPGEKSFRTDYATAQRRLIAVQASIVTELEDFSAKQDSAYLWKPHADSLAYLVGAGQRAMESAGTVLAVAAQRGLNDKLTAMNSSLQKLRKEMQRTIQTLRALPQNNTGQN